MKDIMLSVLRTAGEAIMEVYADEDRFHTRTKPDLSPVTDADLQANQIICDALADHFPDIPVISEEKRLVSYSQRKLYKRLFLVDPLDGTKEFIKRNGEFTINIAYIEGSSPVGGYVYVPCTGMAYLAQQGEGSFQIDGQDHISKLQSKPFYLMDEGLLVVASRSHRDPETEAIISRLLTPKIVSTGSSLKFIRLAEGTANFYPRLAPTMEWDTAAAQCILEEAGGSVIQFGRLHPLLYNKPDLYNPHFIALGALLDPEALIDLLEGI